MVVRSFLPRRTPPRPSSRISRSTVQRATATSLAAQLPPHLARAVDAVVVSVHPADLLLELARRARRGRWAVAVLGGVVGARGDLQPCSVSTRQIGSTPNTSRCSSMNAHERLCGRSSSAAKKADAALRISFARRSSAFSRFSRLISVGFGRGDPGPLPCVDLRLAHPLAHRLGRSDAELCCDRFHRGPLGRVVRPDLRDHAHRALTKLGRVGGRTCHDSILSRNRVSIRPGAVH